ncbi:MAG: leucine-rich repeat protein [Clostridia bacterium]|nr:leucine-rich repeat protein [Clostridia bacterium]
MKKVITLALVLCIILGCVPALATDYETEIHGITYIVANGEAAVKSCKWEVNGTVSVESEIDGCPVTKIGEKAFENCGQIKNITIPDSVKVIEKEAFNRCVNLQEVLGMKNVETIGERAFKLCDFESFTMPEKVKRIEYGTFMDNEFEKFETGNNITFIDDSAFRGCVWLEEVVIGDAVTEIGTAATGRANEDFISKNNINERTPVFQDCSNLKTITLGKSVRYVYPNTFLNLNKLENIFVSEENPHLKSIEGVLFTKDGKSLVCYPRAKTNTEYTIPDGVETIDDKAFYNCDTEKVNAPESLKRVGIYNGVLDECANVERKVTQGRQGNIDWVYDNGVLTFTGNGTLTDTFSGRVVYPTWEWNRVKKIVINEGITEVDGMAGHKNVTEIVLPKTLEKIGGRAFANCDSLESIVISENVSKIDVMAFDECENLKEVVITSKVPLTIGRSAFYIAEGARVYLPETVYQIDELAFSYTWGVMGGYGVGGIVESLTIIAPYGCPAYTWATKKGINVEIGAPQTEITIMVNGVKLNCDSTPYIKNDRTMVPLRAIFEALGAAVTWDDTTKTASGSKDRIEVKITIGENVLYKNGEEIALDCAAEITNSRTMVPVRAISEAFNATVHWDNETKTVEINLNQQ